MAKKLFQTNINTLNNVYDCTKARQTTTGRQVILNLENDIKVREALLALEVAIQKLSEI